MQLGTSTPSSNQISTPQVQRFVGGRFATRTFFSAWCQSLPEGFTGTIEWVRVEGIYLIVGVVPDWSVPAGVTVRDGIAIHETDVTPWAQVDQGERKLTVREQVGDLIVVKTTLALPEDVSWNGIEVHPFEAVISEFVGGEINIEKDRRSYRGTLDEVSVVDEVLVVRCSSLERRGQLEEGEWVAAERDEFRFYLPMFTILGPEFGGLLRIGGCGTYAVCRMPNES